MLVPEMGKIPTYGVGLLHWGLIQSQGQTGVYSHENHDSPLYFNLHNWQSSQKVRNVDPS